MLGVVIRLHASPREGGKLAVRSWLKVVPGYGLETSDGDRRKRKHSRESGIVRLLAIEDFIHSRTGADEYICDLCELSIDIVTVGVTLSDLVGRLFDIRDTCFEGVALETLRYPRRLGARKELPASVQNVKCLRARIVRVTTADPIIRMDDKVRFSPDRLTADNTIPLVVGWKRIADVLGVTPRHAMRYSGSLPVAKKKVGKKNIVSARICDLERWLGHY